MSENPLVARFRGLFDRDWDALHEHEAAERRETLGRASIQERYDDFVALFELSEQLTGAVLLVREDWTERLAALQRRQRVFPALRRHP